MINIFKKGHKTLTSDIEVWAVRWYKIYGEFYDDVKEVAQFFTNKDEAKEFKNSLERANRLLGHTNRKMNTFVLEKVENKGCE